MLSKNKQSFSSMADASLQQLFKEIVALVRETPVTSELQISDAVKLQMYGLYKQATVGPCDEDEAPSRFQLVARAKYHAWLDCRDMTTDEAMMSYVELASSHKHWLGEKCREKLIEWKQASCDASDDTEESTADPVPRPRSSATNDTSCATQDKTVLKVQPTTRFFSWLDRNLGIRPLIPRGQLDISYRDLVFAAWQCVRSSSSMSRYCQLEQQASDLWKSSESAVMVGFSVRSLLDLYLRAASFPAGSEIIMSPPINIPGMIHVLRYHDITVVSCRSS